MKTSTIRARHRAQHLAYFQWFKANFDTRRAVAETGQRNLRIIGNIGLHYQKEFGTNLCIRIHQTSARTRVTLVDTWRMIAPDLFNLPSMDKQKWAQLPCRLELLRKGSPEIIRLIGATNDFRTITQLTAILAESRPILDYKP